MDSEWSELGLGACLTWSGACGEMLLPGGKKVTVERETKQI